MGWSARIAVALCLAPALLVVSGCARWTVGELRRLDQTIELREGQGILVVETESNDRIHRLTIESTDGRGGRFELRGIGTDRRLGLLVIPAGDYRWSQIELPGVDYRGRHYPYVWALGEEEGHWRFSVRPGAINYPGLLVLNRQGKGWLAAFTMNRSGQLVEQLRSRAPALLFEYPLTYSGRMRDDFLEYYSEKFAERRGGEGRDGRQGSTPR